jgi:DNA-3-methyladenine glycosylase I
MTKRTAALAAAAKLSASKAPKVAAKKVGAPKKGVALPIAEDVSTGSTTPQPWYAVFTKSDPEYNQYMATEWGFEKRGDQGLFEKICLEGAQSGLSWLTILRKREAYRKTFHNFDIHKVATMNEKDVQMILDTNEEDPTNMIVRHRGKIEATINNAKCIQAMYEEADSDNQKDDAEHGVLDSFLWSFVNNKPILNTKWQQGQGLTGGLANTPQSEAMSKALKKKGFRFVGPTTCYAMMQSTGMVIDHPEGSPEWLAAVERLKNRPGGYQKDVDVVPAGDSADGVKPAKKRAASKAKSSASSKKSKN